MWTSQITCAVLCCTAYPYTMTQGLHMYHRMHTTAARKQWASKVWSKTEAETCKPACKQNLLDLTACTCSCSAPCTILGTSAFVGAVCKDILHQTTYQLRFQYSMQNFGLKSQHYQLNTECCTRYLLQRPTTCLLGLLRISLQTRCTRLAELW